MGQKINQKQYGKKYSTTEQLTGDVWIDGKPIYRKVVDCGALPNSTTKNVNHDISYDFVTKIEGYSKLGSGSIIPLPFVSNNFATSANGVCMYITTTQIVLINGTDRSDSQTYVILEYTKT